MPVYTAALLSQVASQTANVNIGYETIMELMYEKAASGAHRYYHTEANAYLRNEYKRRLDNVGFTTTVVTIVANVETPDENGIILKIEWPNDSPAE